MKRAIFSLFLGLALAGCSTIKYLPVETVREVYVKDTTYLKDTLIEIQTVTEHYSKYTGLLDTLKISGEFDVATAWVDTTRNALAGEMHSTGKKVEANVSVPIRIIEKIDSVKVEKPYPVYVEKEKKVVPKWAWYSLIYCILATFGIAVYAYFHLKP